MVIDFVVCIKQVPQTGEVEVDPDTGNLLREGVQSQLNPYDLHALEAAFRLREEVGGTVTALSMGPSQAESAVREAFWMGADRGILLSDRRFAGADTLATAYTLACAINQIACDLVITGLQTTDGDTGQVGPGIAEFLQVPHVCYVDEIRSVAAEMIRVLVGLGEVQHTVEVPLPGVISVTRSANQPRLPSFRRKLATADWQVDVWDADNLRPVSDGEGPFFGLEGSATRVQRIFPPPSRPESETWRGDGQQLAERMMTKLKELRFL